MSSIFGGSQQSSSNQSSSSNVNNPLITGALGSQLSNGTQASNTLAGLLGGQGTAAQNAAFQNWQNSTGYQFGLNQGTQAITQNNAASGLLDSGATAKALDTYGQQYANTQYQNYINPLQNLVNSGNQAGSVVGSVGNVSNSSGSSSGSSSTGGLGGFLGSIGAALPSIFPGI